MSQVEHIPETHSLYSPSGSPRWMACPGSIKLVQELGIVSTFSEFADYGSGAHELAAKCLEDRSKQPKDFIGEKVYKDVICDQEMVHGVEEYIDYVLSHVNKESTLYVEKEVRLDHLFPDTKGTADIILLKGKEQELHIMDLKFGKGVSVEAIENSQLKLYAIGALLGLIKAGFHINNKTYKIFLHIFQPRCPHPEGPARVWETNIEDLKFHSKAARKAIELAQKKNPPLVPGKVQCQWCEASGMCKPLAEFNLQIAIEEFKSLATIHNRDVCFKEVNTMTELEIDSVLQQTAQMKNWINNVTAYVQNKLEKGENFEGWKLVRGRSIRKWDTDDTDKITDFLLEEESPLEKEDLFTHKIKSPPQIEKMVSKEFYRQHVQEIVIKPEGALTIAAESDKRPAVKITTASDEFADFIVED